MSITSKWASVDINNIGDVLSPDVYRLMVKKLAGVFVAALRLHDALDAIESSGEEGNPDTEARAALHRKQLES